jgi:hypothetical protein
MLNSNTILWIRITDFLARKCVVPTSVFDITAFNAAILIEGTLDIASLDITGQAADEKFVAWHFRSNVQLNKQSLKKPSSSFKIKW